MLAVMMNKRAGVGRTERLATYVLESLERAGIEYSLVTGSSASDAIQNVTARIHDFSSVLAVGGDGSVHTAAQVAHAHGLPLGIIASGSGDDVARACGLPHGRSHEATIAAADHFIQSYLAKDLTEIDALLATTCDGKQHTVLAVMSCGFDARVNANSSKMTYLRGTFRYVVAMLVTLSRFSPIRYSMILDGVSRNFSAMLVAIGNGSMFGGGMKVCPDAHVKDGYMDLLIVNKLSIPRFLAVFPRVFQGTHTSHEKVETLRGVNLHLDAQGEQIWGDGEYLGVSPVDVELQPNSIKIYGARLS
jgi:diacylglycerol kinase (ATP)